MSSFATPAILLRRHDFGDYDLVLTFFTLHNGKLSTIAKAAKKSSKRFSGVLELFSVIDIVCSIGRRSRLPILTEATLRQPFSKIRASIKRTAYASYWSELINFWMERNQQQIQLYRLLHHVLEGLDSGLVSEEAVSILFQMKFMTIAGLVPNLKSCCICQTETDRMGAAKAGFDLKKGGIVCAACATGTQRKQALSLATIKQLQWIESRDLNRASRIKFNGQTLKEGLDFLEAFVPYHLGKEPRSLIFLRKIRAQ
jgi:DNA repair protein RecO (recombination protein O)